LRNAGKTILVVDDAPEVREIIGDVLRILGYPYEEAANGAEAMPLIRGRRFDIVLCDIHMPGMGGWR
jgi:CheY-like chemotaxis protein